MFNFRTSFNVLKLQITLFRTYNYNIVLSVSLVIIIKNNTIIIIRTFPESFSQENFPMSNNFVKFKSRRMPHHMVFSPLVKYLLYPSYCDDVISHVTIFEKDILAHCEQ